MNYFDFKSFKNTNLFYWIKKYFPLISTIIDTIISIGLFFVSFLIIKYTISPSMLFTKDHTTIILLLIPTTIILLQITNISKIPRTSRYLSIFFDFNKFSAALSIFSFLFIFLLQLKSVSLYTLTLYLIINHFGLFFFRISTYRFFKNYRISGYNYRNVLIIADEHSLPVIKKIRHNKEWGFRILFIITDSEKLRQTAFGGNVKTFPEKINLKSLLDIDIIDEVIYCKSKLDNEHIKSVIRICNEVGITFRLQNEFIPQNYVNGLLTQLEDIPILTMANTPENKASLVWKSTTDSIFAFMALLFLSPFLLFVALLIKLDSKGPVFFKQKRVGLRGRQFYIYKFRTMVVNAEEIKEKLKDMNEADGPAFKIKNDPRITRIGRFLRKTSIDEVPQLLNVLKGEMALVGPRPPIPDEVKVYDRWQLRRLSVKPGITCTWQIIPNRNSVLFDKWVKLDLNYIDNWSLIKDFKLILKTVKAVFFNSGY